MRLSVGDASHANRDDGPEQRQTRTALVECWPDGRDDAVAAGTITILADGDVWLDLDSDEWNSTDRDDDKFDVSVLVGTGASGKPLRLDGVHFVSGHRDFLSGRSHARYVVDRTIFGSAEPADAVVLSELFLNFRGLREWLDGGWARLERALPLVQPSSADAELADEKDFELRRAVRQATWNIGEVDVQANVTKASKRISRWTSTYETTASLDLTCTDGLKLPEWHRDWVEPLRDLVAFATREQTVTLRLSGLTPAGEDVELCVAPETAIVPVSHHEYYQRDLLPAAIWGPEGIADLIGAWRALHIRLGGTATELFELMNSFDVPPLTRLLRLSACAEGYHRVLHDKPPFEEDEHEAYVAAMEAALPDEPAVREHYRQRLMFANSQSQRMRIRWLFSRAAEVDERLDGMASRLTKRIVDRRNRQTHLSASSSETDDLPWLNAILSYALAANILLDIGLDEDDVAFCLAHGYVWDNPVLEL